MDLLTAPPVMFVLGMVAGAAGVTWVRWAATRPWPQEAPEVETTPDDEVWREQLASVEAEAAALRSRLRQREQRLTALTVAFERQRARVAELVSAEAHAAVVDAAAEQAERLAALAAEVDRLREERDELRAAVAAREVRVSSLRRHVATLEARVEGGPVGEAGPGDVDLAMDDRSGPAPRAELDGAGANEGDPVGQARQDGRRDDAAGADAGTEAAASPRQEADVAAAGSASAVTLFAVGDDPVEAFDVAAHAGQVVDVAGLPGTGDALPGTDVEAVDLPAVELATIDLVHDVPARATTIDLGPDEEADDLTRIEGVGPAMAAALQAAGLSTYAAVADADEATLRSAVKAAGLRFAPSLATWSQQATHLARGDEAGFAALVDDLVGGLPTG